MRDLKEQEALNAKIANERILAHRARERGAREAKSFYFSSPLKALRFHKECEELLTLADKKLENLKAQREIHAVLFLELCKMWGVPIADEKSEQVENLVSLIDSLISLKIQCFCNDFRDNPLPKLFRERSQATELLYARAFNEKPKTKCCNVCGGEFIPIANGNYTCGECLLRGGKPARQGGGKL